MGRTNRDFSRSKKPGHHQTQKMIGNVMEGQGYADKRKRKILSTYKKMIRKNRTAESKTSSGNIEMVTGSTLNPTTASVHSKPHHGTTHYTKNVTRHPHKEKNRYTKAEHKTGSLSQARNTTGVTRYTKAELQRQRLTQEHQQKLQEKKARWQTREEALRKYRETKEARHKKLGKRTPKGQPIIKYQMEYLLQKIQSQTAKD